MAKIIKTEKNEITADGMSFQIDFGDGMVLWFDTWTDDNGELTGDWNKYIFFTRDSEDMKQQAFQGDAENYATALETIHISERLEYLRGEIIAERISNAEIAELESLKDYIEEGDVLLLEWASVPEFEDN